MSPKLPHAAVWTNVRFGLLEELRYGTPNAIAHDTNESLLWTWSVYYVGVSQTIQKRSLTPTQVINKTI